MAWGHSLAALQLAEKFAGFELQIRLLQVVQFAKFTSLFVQRTVAMAGQDLEVGVGSDGVEAVRVTMNDCCGYRQEPNTGCAADGADGAGVPPALPAHSRRGES